jgi:hypothetical protein
MAQQTFVARIIYRICCTGITEEQYEEQWRLVFAEDERVALFAALQLAARDEDHFTDRRGRTIQWKLIAVKDLQPVSLTHGSLMASVISEVAPVAAPVWPG